MIQEKLTAVLRSRGGRVLMAALGLGVVGALLHHFGFHNVWEALRRLAWTVPLVMLLDFVYFACEVVGLRALYGADRGKIPVRELIRGSLIGHTVAVLVPMGKPVGEGVKATLFAKWTSVPRALAAVARFQGVVLVVNTLICVPLAVAAFTVAGPSLLPLAIAINAVITLVVGGGILLMGKHSRVGDWLARRLRHARQYGPEFDAVLRNEPMVPLDAIAWCFTGRVIQCLEYTVLLYAMTGSFPIARGLTALGIALVGASMGEILPNGLGATEANFAYFAPLLALSRSDALAIPMIAHVSVLAWAAVGAVVPLVWKGGPHPPGVSESSARPSPDRPGEGHPAPAGRSDVAT